MNKKRLQLEQLDRKLRGFNTAAQVTPPPTGWLKAVRVSLGMSLQQLADKLSITKQSVQEIETREKEGNITLKTLKDTASALDMQLVYGFVPKDGTLDDLIERKAKELAIRIVSRTSNTMKLEDQENSKQRIKKAIEERTAIIKNEMPKMLWD
ncbi:MULTISPECIES: mobile mystery protein A [Flavobacteriaceae]|jgi:predicted DNA-binding mobile mystery protein A|uniref:Mobile mystery protein A n=2 Tax=Flavobacteriaceae TaxID=49546 RepID=A0ABW0C5F3_9FLAO|nr:MULTISPECIES: mobile mystery protein A [Flavobacteriaceae]MBB4119495.1 putative DNA-binding mobile mystery protein A [Mesonia hippocampi]MDX1773483.1 mobile mystery protein A [Oceanihabitans sediminis]